MINAIITCEVASSITKYSYWEKRILSLTSVTKKFCSTFAREINGVQFRWQYYIFTIVIAIYRAASKQKIPFNVKRILR